MLIMMCMAHAIHPWSQFSILYFCVVLELFGSIVSYFYCNGFYMCLQKILAEALLNRNNVNLSRLLQVCKTFLIMALPAIVFASIVNKKPFEYIGFNRAISGKQVFINSRYIFIGL